MPSKGHKVRYENLDNDPKKYRQLIDYEFKALLTHVRAFEVVGKRSLRKNHFYLNENSLALMENEITIFVNNAYNAFSSLQQQQKLRTAAMTGSFDQFPKLKRPASSHVPSLLAASLKAARSIACISSVQFKIEFRALIRAATNQDLLKLTIGGGY